MLHKRWLVLMWLCVIVVATTGCERRQSGTAEALKPRTETVAAQLDADYFRPIGLEPYWSCPLELGVGEKIKQIWLAPSSIYCLTSKNMLHRLDRDTGVTSWIRQPAAAGRGRLIRRPVEVDGKTLVVAHNIAKVYKTETVQLLGEVRLAFGVNSDPAYDGKVLYIADSIDRVVAIELESGHEIWSCRAEKATSARPVYMGTTLISASESGEVCAHDTRLYDPLWPNRFRTRGAILVPPVLTAEGRCYVVGGDSMLYCLRSDSGDELWRYFAEASLPNEPTVVDGRVFLNVAGKGLIALDARNGAELEGFHYPEGQGYLGRVNDRLYIVTADQRIVCVDAESGEQLAELGLKDFDFFISNEKRGRIFIASRAGRIVCLQGLGVDSPGLAGFKRTAQYERAISDYLAKQ